MQITTIYNYKGPKGEVNNSDSLTVPGEAYTINQLLERANGGIPLNSLVEIKEGHFASEADFDTFVPEADYDIAEAHEDQQKAAQIIADAKKALAKQKEAEHTTKESDVGVIEKEVEAHPNKQAKVPKTGLETPQPDQ